MAAVLGVLKSTLPSTAEHIQQYFQSTMHTAMQMAHCRLALG